jgi:hypothetical protein
MPLEVWLRLQRITTYTASGPSSAPTINVRQMHYSRD